MRNTLAVGLSLLTSAAATAQVTPPAGAATQVVVDLSGTGSVSQTVDPGTYTVVIHNRLPQARYGVIIRKELLPIAAIAFDPIGSLGGLTPRTERTDPCPALSAATTALNESTSESQVPPRLATLNALVTQGCADPTIVAAATTARAGASQILPTQLLRGGERLTVTVTRAAPDEVLTWTLVLETEPRGEWRTSYGVSFVPDRDKRYHTEAAGDDKFTIVEDDADRALKPPMPSVYFSWLSSEQKRRDWSWSPTIGFGLDSDSVGVFGGVSVSFNQNISVIGGIAVAGQKRLISRYTPGQEIGENLSDDQLHELDFRPTPVIAVTVRFDRNPFRSEDSETPAPAETPALVSPQPVGPATPPTPGPDTDGPEMPGGGAPEASRDSDLKLRFDAKGALRDPAMVATLLDRARTATDVFIVSHGWWNDESAADCFYRRIVGGIAGTTPGYLTADRYRPLFVTTYWPSALFPMEPSDCDPAGRTESAAVNGFGEEGVRRWATLAFPDAVARPAFGAETARVAALLDRERTANLSEAEAEELVGTLVNWRGAIDAAGEAAEPGAFAGTAHDIALAWSQRPESRSEFSVGGVFSSKKWLNFGNAFTFWTMKQRAGVVGSTGLYAIVKALQPLRAQKVRVHLIGHSFGGKLVTASLTGSAGSAPNHADSLVILQGAFSQFAFATKEQILAAGIRVDRGGLYRDALLSSLVTGPIVATHSSADAPNRLLYPLGVALVGDVTEASRAPRFGSLGANGILGVTSVPLVLKQKRLADLDVAAIRAVSVDASGVVGGHSDLVKPQVFGLIWDAVEHNR